MLKWIDEKYRLVLMNDETFQEERSFRLVPFNVFTIIGLVIMGISLLTIILLIFTPLNYMIPSKNDQGIRNQVHELYLQMDSLEQEVQAKELSLAQLKSLVHEDFEYEDAVEDAQKNNSDGEVDMPEKSSELQELMERVDNEAELGNLIENTLEQSTNISTMIFTAPLKGIVSDTFAPARSHFGTDIVAPKGSVIKATQKGTVVVATWSADTGHMLAIQHDNNVISFYKHNASLLKKTGDIVTAGEGIAIIGNTGELTEGPHLHFEMWYQGQPINAQRYIQFSDQ